MSLHFIDKERAFVESLPADTGRDLEAWMEAIRESGLEGRNEIIDWLRQRGFPFSRASWLERIHHNGGRLIYAGGGPAGPASKPRSTAPRQTVSAPAPPDGKAPPPSQVAEAGLANAPPPRATPPPATMVTDGDLETLLGGAKAYRPLAQAMLRDMLGLVPGADMRLDAGAIVFELGRPFAAIAPSPKGVRLSLPEAAALAGWQRSKPSQSAAASARETLSAKLTASLLLTDARQLDSALWGAVAEAARQAGEGSYST